LIDLNEEGSFNEVDFDTHFRSIPKVNPSNVVVVESSQPLVPKRPLYVGPSHFNCSLGLPEIRRRVEQQLNNVFEVSFKFIASDCRVRILPHWFHVVLSKCGSFVSLLFLVGS
jgi:hypothetical protein